MQRVGDPGPPWRDLGADRDVAAPAAPARARGARFEVGEPGEVQDVAQPAQLLGAQHIGCGEMMPDEPVLHLLQQQSRFGRRRFDGVDRVDDLVLDCLGEVERSIAAAQRLKTASAEGLSMRLLNSAQRLSNPALR